MKLEPMITLILTISLLSGCGDNKANNITGTANNSSSESKTTANASESQQGSLVGEWDQQYTCFDKNGNYKLEPEEKKPSNTRLGFNWFKFNADGSCLRDKDIKFEGTYEIAEKNGSRKLMIQGGDNLRYTITGLTDQELILGSDGAFIVFKRIK